jgi:hypothetical protein
MAKKKASGAAAAAALVAETSSCTDQELQAAGVVDASGQLMEGLAHVVNAAVNATVRQTIREWLDERASSSLQGGPASGGGSGAGNADAGVDLLHRWFIRRDFDNKPYLRVFGRIMEIMLNHRRFETVTAGDVFKFFLVEIPDQLDEHHRQNLEAGQDFDVSMQPARRTFNKRMERMCREQLARPTVWQESGKGENFVLTEDGQTLFGDWPLLTDIPGLELHGPVTPENSAGRRPRRRS